MSEAILTIRNDRAAMFEKRHPWVFSGAIRSSSGDPVDGDIVALRDEDGQFLARGYCNSQSQISVHVLSWDEDEAIDERFWRELLIRAIAGRAVEQAQGRKTQAAYRVVNAENDALPGLVVDRYGDYLVLQALTLGIERRKQMIAKLLMDLLSPAGIYERSDVDVRLKEGLPSTVGLLAGKPPPPLIEIDENGRRFLVDVYSGHKTGFYLDQRFNRLALANHLRFSPDGVGTVLNCFSYSGGFSVYALDSMVERVINVDASADAMALAKRNIGLNGFSTFADQDFVVGDVFDVLRKYRAAGQQFDMIVLDPPKFAHNQKQIESAARGYKDINMLAFQLIKPGGMLMTFSCSGLVDADLFQKIVFGALVDARREAQIVGRLTAGSDHPVSLMFPEGSYLKGLFCRVW